MTTPEESASDYPEPEEPTVSKLTSEQHERLFNANRELTAAKGALERALAWLPKADTELVCMREDLRGIIRQVSRIDSNAAELAEGMEA